MCLNISKYHRKCLRKVSSVVARSSHDIFLEISSSPSEVLLIANHGEMNTEWRTSHHVKLIFAKFGSIGDVQLIPQKSFTIIQFDHVEDCESAYQSLQGQDISLLNLQNMKTDRNNSKIYLSFLTSFEKTKISIRSYLSKMALTLSDASDIPGLSTVHDFLNSTEEAEILNSLNWEKDSCELKSREVIHFNYDFSYDSNSIDGQKYNGRPMPDCLQTLLQRCIGQQSAFNVEDYQCTVNKYDRGCGIAPHIDSHACCDDTIYSVTLNNHGFMNFVKRSPDPFGNILDGKWVKLEQRSMLKMSGDARYIYSHGIPSRHSDIVNADTNTRTSQQVCDDDELMVIERLQPRVSLTFRKVVLSPVGHTGFCSCDHLEYCDDKRRFNGEHGKNDVDAVKLEKQFVHDVYDNISNHFSETRQKAWPKIADFVTKRAVFCGEGSCLLDVGCGNGKYLGSNSSQFQIGVDHCASLAKIALEKGMNNVVNNENESGSMTCQIDALTSDIMNLPFRCDVFDTMICIAVIHHLSTKQRRIHCITEMTRILKCDGGQCLIYVWAKDQKKLGKKSSYLKKEESSSVVHEVTRNSETNMVNGYPVHKNRTQFKHSDVMVPWTLKSSNDNNSGESKKTHHRLYHVYDEGELEEDIKKCGYEVKIIDQWYDQGNWCCLFEKQ